METSTGPVMTSLPTTNTTGGANISEADQHECHVHSLTAKVFLNCPIEDLIPSAFIRKAEKTNTVRHKPWIFRAGVDDGRDVDLSDWSNVDIRYRGVFKTLAKAPEFEKGLWDGGCEACEDDLSRSNPEAQAHVVYALMKEVGAMLDLSRETKQRDAIFSLRPHVLPYQLEYWTGFRERHYDAPLTSGCLSLEFEPSNRKPSMAILPVSTTVKEESLTSCLEGKFKLLLAQLLIHARYLTMPGDKIPDQEIFMIGLHGSKLHLMRAYFPGQKVSSIWCRREVPGPCPIVVEENPDLMEGLSPPSSTSSPDTAHTGHIENTDVQIGSQSTIHTETSASETSTGVAQQVRTNTHTPGPSHMESFEHRLEQARLAALDNELDLHTFRVLATREYDLWNREDFTAVVHIFVALQMYLLSNSARCGVLMDTFRKHPFPRRGFTTVNFDCENTTRVMKPKTKDKPDTNTKHDNDEAETYLDSDSELSTNEVDDDALYQEFSQLDTKERHEGGQRQEHRPVEQVVEQWRAEVIPKRDAEEAGCAVEGDQINMSQNAHEGWWDLAWVDDMVQWKILGVFDGQEPEEEGNGES